MRQHIMAAVAAKSGMLMGVRGFSSTVTLKSVMGGCPSIDSVIRLT